MHTHAHTSSHTRIHTHTHTHTHTPCISGQNKMPQSMVLFIFQHIQNILPLDNYMSMNVVLKHVIKRMQTDNTVKTSQAKH